jgi:hypothetical protein
MGVRNGKVKELEGSANANDLWVWMRPHIRFCTIGKCDLLSFFLSIESLPAACKFHPLFFSFLLLKHGASSYEVSPLLLFNHCSFFSISFFLSLSLFNHLVNMIKVGTRNDKGLTWSLWIA